jgi:lysophospholipase L1-like esterase
MTAAVGLTAVWLGVVVVPPWVSAIVPRSVLVRATIGFLTVLEVTYVAVWAVALIATPILGGVVYRARCVATSLPWSNRGLLLGTSCLLGLLAAEVIVAARRPSIGPVRRAAEIQSESVIELTNRFNEPRDDRKVTVAVLGESSAFGVPYEKWLSIGRIVTWQLEHAMPEKRFHLALLATPGDTLELQHRKLASLTRRPDCIIIYCGHNEFFSTIPSFRRPDHYRDVREARRSNSHLLPCRVSPILGLIRQTRDQYSVGIRPPPDTRQPLVDVPVYTPADFAERLADFACRLESITAYAESIKALPILVVPPANDGDFEPNRSFLPAETSRSDREAFARDFLDARRLEDQEPKRALVRYRNLLERQPGFAEAHYRLGRLLEYAGAWDEAYEHYVAARDCDGHPMRCVSKFQQAYRDVAAKHNCVLIDGQALFHAMGPHGLLNDHLFHDGVHPSLGGQIALAQAILEGLRARHAFGWTAVAPVPSIDPAQCAAHFGLTHTDLSTVALCASGFYGAVAILRYDPSQRHAKARAYTDAARRIAAGEAADLAGLPNLRVQTNSSAPHARDVLLGPPRAHTATVVTTEW